VFKKLKRTFCPAQLVCATAIFNMQPHEHLLFMPMGAMKAEQSTGEVLVHVHGMNGEAIVDLQAKTLWAENLKRMISLHIGVCPDKQTLGIEGRESQLLLLNIAYGVHLYDNI